MSQHDFNIANQTFPSFRSDLNDALVAAATMSAGASAPTTPYAYQLWFDTTTGTWKVRNSGNTAWISTITTDLATGSVGIGTVSPSSYGRLAVMTPTTNFGYFGIGNSVGGGGGVNIGSFYGTTKISYIDTVLENGTPSSEQSRLQFATIAGGTLTERMRIDGATGNLLVGTTTGGGTIGSYNGFGALSGGTIFSSATSNRSIFARRSTDGAIIEFRRDGSTVGSIGVVGGHPHVASASGYVGIGGSTGNPFMYSYDGALYPTTDNYRDLGTSGQRWDDVYATNGTIQTSDANEKQQIAALTDAEITAAKAISQLFKTFKWNDAVSEKGDAARTHAGVIAQDVQAAMTAAGLNAGDYAFFISSTWWETQTEVPAVEAVEAVDAVYEDVVIPAVEEELDEDGNVIVEAQPERTDQHLVSEAIEAVEAAAAYTRTDTYDTAEEAPEGAVERTRLGIRYPELLAFVGAATEQRLANIETRLTALEA